MEKLEYNLKILGGFYLPEPLDASKSATITCEVDIYEVSKKDLEQDDEYRLAYKSKVVGMPEIVQGDRKIKARLKTGKSKTWRYIIEKSGLDYEDFMDQMISNSEEVIEFVRRLDKKQ